MADPADPNQVASPLPGLVVGVAVAVGDPVRKGQKLLSIEAMKMETTIYAERPGRVAELLAAGRPPGQDGRAAAPVERGMTSHVEPNARDDGEPWPFVRR